MIDKDLQQHYTSGHLHEAVLAAIIEAGYDPDNLDIDPLAPRDGSSSFAASQTQSE